MHRLAIVLSCSVLACATPVALRVNGDVSDFRGCLDEEDACPTGGSGDTARWLVYGFGAAALGLAVGALIREIVRWRPAQDHRADG